MLRLEPGRLGLSWLPPHNAGRNITAVFVLNVLAFFLIGLQIRPIMEPLDPAQRTEYLVVAGAVLTTCILTRILWVMSCNTAVRWGLRRRGFRSPRPMSPPTFRGGLIISWAGMRGIVTLAAALALPLGDGSVRGFPFRDLIVLTAFIVVFGTLVIQGLTLRPLLSWLDLHDDDPVGREVALAREAAFRAALQAIDGDTSAEAEWLRQGYAELLRLAGSDVNGEAPITLRADALQRRALAAASSLRRKGEIGDDAFHHFEEQLDWAELSAGPRPDR
jgi:monovalent cation/hydrogen antiporter